MHTAKLLPILVAAVVSLSVTSAQTITTICGSGDGGGYFNGDSISALHANLSGVIGVAVDNSNNILIADRDNNRIRKIDNAGIITTIAGFGSSSSGGDGGPAVLAGLRPEAIALDNSGNIYFTDVNDNRVRKIDASGIITTIAGTGDPGFSGDGGRATMAKLFGPVGIAWYSNEIYFTDYGNHRLRKINSAGIISTIAGTETPGYNGDNIPATTAELYYPRGIAISPSGIIYICDVGNRRIREITLSGNIQTFAGNGMGLSNGDGGPATNASLTPVYTVFNSAGYCYVTDGIADKIRSIDPSGIINTLAGTGHLGFDGDGGSAAMATLNSPMGIALNLSGNLIFSDFGNKRIRSITLPPVFVTTDENLALGVSFYPNPASRYTIIEVTQFTLPFDITIADDLGRVVKHIHMLTPSQKIDLDLPNGFYFVSGQNDQFHFQKKLFIDR